MTAIDNLKKKVRRITDVIEELRKLAPHCGTNTFIAFVTVATEPGVTVGEVQRRIGLPPTATARAIGMLFRQARGQEGLNLIETRPDAIDGRVKHLHLTSRGERVWGTMAKHLEGF